MVGNQTGSTIATIGIPKSQSGGLTDRA